MFSSLQTGYQKRLSTGTARPWALNTALTQTHTHIELQRKHLCINSVTIYVLACPCIQQLEKNIILIST